MAEPDDSGHTYVDLTSAEYAARWRSSETPLYRKTATVRARLLTVDAPLATVLADGTRETDRVAPAGHLVVENPGGEQYAVEPAAFKTLYEATTEPGVFRPKGRIRVIENPTGGPVWIDAPWGERQYGAADCRFACPVRSDGALMLAEPYIIGRAELDQTYTEATESPRITPDLDEFTRLSTVLDQQAPAVGATRRKPGTATPGVSTDRTAGRDDLAL